MGPGHQGTFLGSLHNLGTAASPHEAAVLEEAFVPGKSVRKVLERQQAQAPDLSAAELPLELHAIGAPKDSVSMKPALMKLAFIPGNRGDNSLRDNI